MFCSCNPWPDNFKICNKQGIRDTPIGGATGGWLLVYSRHRTNEYMYMNKLPWTSLESVKLLESTVAAAARVQGSRENPLPVRNNCVPLPILHWPRLIEQLVWTTSPVSRCPRHSHRRREQSWYGYERYGRRPPVWRMIGTKCVQVEHQI